MSEGIYNMNMSVNFLLQATRVLSFNNYDEDELKMVYDFMISIDNEILNDYNMSCSIIIYNNDLELINIKEVEGNFYAVFIIELNGFYCNSKTKTIRLVWNLLQFKLEKIKKIIFSLNI